VVGYQFRYDSQDARARYLVREIDPSDLTEVQVSGASTWHEYVGGSIFHDLALRRGVAGLMPTPCACVEPTRPLKRGHGTRCRVFKPWMVPSSHPRFQGARSPTPQNSHKSRAVNGGSRT